MEISCCYISHVVVSGGPGGSFRCFKLDNQEIINAGQINDQSTMDENKYASRYVHRLANPKIVSMFQLSILYIYTVQPLASSFRIIWFINVETGVSENVSRRCGIGIIMEDIANSLSLFGIATQSWTPLRVTRQILLFLSIAEEGRLLRRNLKYRAVFGTRIHCMNVADLLLLLTVCSIAGFKVAEAPNQGKAVLQEYSAANINS